ncbi:hypothetical protein BKD03_16665 [Brucella sp. 09RB8471]|nr:hypothetical protein BKD03_16665 [Brucella sp. 09RB8471]
MFSIPVRIIPSPRSNENGAADAKAREESHRREDENLAIQRSIADSSKDVAHYTYLQIWLGAFSLGFSFATACASGFAAWFAYGAVKEARQSTWIAQKALEVTEDATKKQLRPYLVLDNIYFTAQEDGRIVVGVVFLNAVQTPAIIKNITRDVASFPVDTHYSPSPISSSANIIVGPNCAHTFTNTISVENALILIFSMEIQSRERAMAVYFDLSYTDFLDGEYRSVITRKLDFYDGDAHFMSDIDIPDIST